MFTFVVLSLMGIGFVTVHALAQPWPASGFEIGGAVLIPPLLWFHLHPKLLDALFERLWRFVARRCWLWVSLVFVVMACTAVWPSDLLCVLCAGFFYLAHRGRIEEERALIQEMWLWEHDDVERQIDRVLMAREAPSFRLRELATRHALPLKASNATSRDFMNMFMTEEEAYEEATRIGIELDLWGSSLFYTVKRPPQDSLQVLYRYAHTPTAQHAVKKQARRACLAELRLLQRADIAPHSSLVKKAERLGVPLPRRAQRLLCGWTPFPWGDYLYPWVVYGGLGSVMFVTIVLENLLSLPIGNLFLVLVGSGTICSALVGGYRASLIKARQAQEALPVPPRAPSAPGSPDVP